MLQSVLLRYEVAVLRAFAAVVSLSDAVCAHKVLRAALQPFAALDWHF